MKREVPEPWATAMIAAGFVDTRYNREVASMRQLAIAAHTTTSTVSAMMAGARDTDGKILSDIATALKVEPQMVFSWVNRKRTETKPFEPHRDADLLTHEEQEAVNELIRLLALPKKRGGEHGGDTAATNDGPRGPFDDDLDKLPDEREERPPIEGRSLPQAARKEDEE